MTLHKGAATTVLAGHSNTLALDQERTEGQQFAESPVDSALATHFESLFEQLLEFWVNGEAWRLVVVGVTDQFDNLAGDCSFVRDHRVVACGGADSNRARGQLHRLLHRGMHLGEGILELRLECGVCCFKLFASDVASADQRF